MMKRALVAAVLVLSVAFMAANVWAADVQGVVKTIQVNDRVLTLDDGTKLHWTESITVSQDVKEGAQVKATYEPQGDKYVLTKIEIIK
jgi:hypothetical protein